MCKRLLLLAACVALLLQLTGLRAYAAEEVIFGPIIVTRTTGRPKTLAYNFERPEHFGPPFRLLIINGGDTGAGRVSSGEISLNGQAVLSPSDLNQQVSRIERQVALSQSNRLLVTLRSAPGSFLSISVYGQKLSEVPNEVGRARLTTGTGGTITIPPNAPGLGGASILIPPDAAMDDIEIQVGFEPTLPGPLSAAAVAGGAVQVSHTVVLKVANGGKSTFSKPVTISIPYDLSLAGNLPPAVLHWDADAARYRTASVIAVDRVNGLVTFQTSHFSSFVAIVLKQLGLSIPDTDTGFRIAVDSILHSNFGSYQFGGHCAAFASMSTYYYSLAKPVPLYLLAQEGMINQPVDDELTRTALTLTYSYISSVWNSVAQTLVFPSESDAGLLMIASMIITGDPVHMVIYDNNQNNGGHSVTVYGYDSSNTRFRIYDSNFPQEEVTFGWNIVTGFGSYSKASLYPSGFFDRIGYASDDTFGSPAQFHKIISDWENGSLVDFFQNLSVVDEKGTSQALTYGGSVTVLLKDVPNQSVTGAFVRPAGSTKTAYLHVYINGVRDAARATAIDASGAFTVSFPVKVEQKTEVMLIVSEHPADIGDGFTAFGVFNVEPETTNFFRNFGFESGDLTGWITQTTLRSTGGVWTPTKATVMNVGFDPIAADIPTVQFGNYSLRVNDSDPNYHVTFAAQQAVVPATGNPQVRFRWAAVLEDPQHSPADQPYVDVVVHDVSAGAELYRRRFYTSDPSFGGWRPYQNGQWKAIPWQTVVLTGLSAYAGHTIEVRVIGADCALGGHGGYVYLDGEQ